MNQRGIAHRSRWIAHLENRLAYEKAMLGESGGLKADRFDLQPGGQVLRRGRWHVIVKVNRSAGAVRSVTVLGHFAATIAVEDIADYRAPADGVAEKVKAATKLAPMCNFPGEGFRHMTRAEWERKKMSDVPQPIRHKANERHGAHRTRATSGGGWTTVPVFLTDVKRVDPPAPSAPEPAPQIETLPPEPRTPPVPQATDPVAEGFATLKATLKAGVKVAVAPQLFPTPPGLAVRMVELAGIEAGDRVLEPSAGTGNLARAIRNAVPDAHLDLIEIDPRLCSILQASGFEVSCSDFLAASMPICPDSEGGHDRVLMNPPFSKGQDVAHILHALKFLKPGGRLVALCANGPRQQAELRPLATTWEELPEGTFADQGTSVRAVLMMVRR
jgi:phospholipid N-methyltransferase